MTRIIVASLFVLFGGSSALAQPASGPLPAPADVINLAGPRIGTTFLSSGIVDQVRGLAPQMRELNPVITQFGWQFEKRFYGANGLTPVTEWVVLVGGADQGVVIPSFSWLAGLRTARGLEFAVGPNFSPAGAAFVLAGGVTLSSGRLNFPLNLAVVPSKSGVRVSFLAGFNARR